MAVPGWKHQLDLTLRDCLSSLAWFPDWLQKLKAVSSFLRTETYVQQVSHWLKGQGVGGLAEMVKKCSPPNFAEWRWGTLLKVAAAIKPVLLSLIVVFPFALFRKSRNQAQLDLIAEAFSSASWSGWQFDFVLWLSGFITDLMQWGCGCSCHHLQLQSGEVVDCPRKGRRLHEAGRHLEQEQEKALALANSWATETWSCSFAELSDLQGCVRLMVALFTKKMRYLYRLPYLLARLREPGIRQQVYDQWNSVRPEEHHRVTQKWLIDGMPLRRHIDMMNPDGTNVHPELEAAIIALAAAPLDDSVSEGPHARWNKFQNHAKAATFAWNASTMRMAQNLDDARNMIPTIDADLASLWCNWKTLLRLPGANAHKAPRMNLKHVPSIRTRCHFLRYASRLTQGTHMVAATITIQVSLLTTIRLVIQPMMLHEMVMEKVVTSSHLMKGETIIRVVGLVVVVVAMALANLPRKKRVPEIPWR